MCFTGAGEPEEDELYESAIEESNGVYRLLEDKLVPYEEAWASIPSVSLLNSKEVKHLKTELFLSLASKLYTPKHICVCGRRWCLTLVARCMSGRGRMFL